ncbi:hypothetical protein EV426DRAFT_621139 [Tirmania nivea]|nr:hypothetical protein EV426DRAFT_621139 [Tirmania nivea]
MTALQTAAETLESLSLRGISRCEMYTDASFASFPKLRSLDIPLWFFDHSEPSPRGMNQEIPSHFGFSLPPSLETLTLAVGLVQVLRDRTPVELHPWIVFTHPANAGSQRERICQVLRLKGSEKRGGTVCCPKLRRLRIGVPAKDAYLYDREIFEFFECWWSGKGLGQLRQAGRNAGVEVDLDWMTSQSTSFYKAHRLESFVDAVLARSRGEWLSEDLGFIVDFWTRFAQVKLFLLASGFCKYRHETSNYPYARTLIFVACLILPIYLVWCLNQ